MRPNPIVTWASPWQAANSAWLEAAEHMEFHRWEQAERCLLEHARQFRLLLTQLAWEKARDHEIAVRAAAAVRAREDEARQRLSELRVISTGGGCCGSADWGG